jgi:outer membrane protein insertion porin family
MSSTARLRCLARAALWGALAGALWIAPPAGAGVLRGGPEPFSVDSLSAWRGRIVRDISFVGRKVTQEHVIQREIRTKIGEPLDLTMLAADYRRLENIAIFSDIRIEAREDGDDGVALTFVFKESPSFVPFPSFIYTEENGFSVGAAVSALNLGGLGLRARGSAYFGGTTQYYANLDWPWMYGTNHDSANLLVAHRERTDQLRGFNETSDEITTRLGRYLGERGRGSINFSWVRMGSDVPGITLTPDNEDDLLRLGFTLGWDTRDSWRNPRSGWQSEMAVWRTGGFLGGDGDSWSLDLDLRRYIPTAARQKVLLSNLLTLQSGTLGQDVPVYFDYYMGGANSIRGYGITQLGTPFSGKNQLIETAEYSFTLMPLRRWDLFFLSFSIGAELAVFADGGIAWNEASEFALRRARGGMGAGLRLLIPGQEMVRLDIGWSPQGGFQFHFASGTKPAAQRNRLR